MSSQCFGSVSLAQQAGELCSVGLLPVDHHRVEPVLGTRLDVSIAARRARHRDAALRTLLAEFDCGERRFSIFRSDSELSRWRRGELTANLSPELCELLVRAAQWHRLSCGAFNPNVGQMTRRWRQAEAEGRLPTDEELAAIAASAAHLPYAVDDDRIVPTGACVSIDLNAFAKGLIVDSAVRTAWAAHDLETLLVNLGGDLVHRGAGHADVAVEHPDRRRGAVRTLRVDNCAVATSGSSWRGFRVGAQWFGHVLDPRTARPVEAVSSATVVADDAATADMLATILMVDGAAATGLVEAHARSWMLVGCDGRVSECPAT
jgi:FAD:protein FMN transferase